MIETWTEGVADENMPEELLVALGAVVRRHPWFQARARLTEEILTNKGVRPPARILDAGCGWGVTMVALERAGYRVDGMDISRRTLERLDRDRPDRKLIVADLTQPIPDGVAAYDAVLALDVIEHIDDDRSAVGQIAGLARPEGLVVLSVPALPGLFTRFDEVQGHRRRYVPESLRAAIDGTRLEVETIFWWGEWLVPLLRRQRSRRVEHVTSAAEVYRHYLRLPPGRSPGHSAWPSSRSVAAPSRAGSGRGRRCSLSHAGRASLLSRSDPRRPRYEHALMVVGRSSGEETRTVALATIDRRLVAEVLRGRRTIEEEAHFRRQISLIVGPAKESVDAVLNDFGQCSRTRRDQGASKWRLLRSR